MTNDWRDHLYIYCGGAITRWVPNDVQLFYFAEIVRRRR